MSRDIPHRSEYPYDPPSPGVHMPMTPTWTCTGCMGPWPCGTKRRRLLTEYADAPLSLYLLMAMRLTDAAGDLPHVPAGELYARFLGWVREGQQAPPATRQVDTPGASTPCELCT
ncbi:MAG TPA: hypothetical protein VK453_18230 [Micromonosporaceae bacterium]|nr:hypothetical protein [Micromonosporaceae bacterium]